MWHYYQRFILFRRSTSERTQTQSMTNMRDALFICSYTFIPLLHPLFKQQRWNPKTLSPSSMDWKGMDFGLIFMQKRNFQAKLWCTGRLDKLAPFKVENKYQILMKNSKHFLPGTGVIHVLRPCNLFKQKRNSRKFPKSRGSVRIRYLSIPSACQLLNTLFLHIWASMIQWQICIL